MASQGGHITAFDGIDFHNGTNRFAIKPMVDEDAVILLTRQLPNGAIANYDGTSDSNVGPGTASQDFLVKTGTAKTAYANLRGKLGNQGTLTFAEYTAGTTHTCTAILTRVADATPDQAHSGGDMVITCEFQRLNNWS